MAYTTPDVSMVAGGTVSAANDVILGANQIFMLTDTIRLARGSADVALTTAYQDATGMSVSCDKDGNWLVFAVVNCRSGASSVDGGRFEAQLDVGGTPDSETAWITNEKPGVNVTNHLVGVWEIAISGTTTVKIQIKHTSNATNRDYVADSSVLVAFLKEGA